MRVSRTYGGNHFKGEEMDDKPLLLTIDQVDCKEFSSDGGPAKEKLVMAFKETDQTMVVNMTNAQIIAGLYGDETDDWVGEKIVVFKGRTRFGSKMVDCVSVRGPRPAANAGALNPAAQPPRRRPEPLTQQDVDAPDDGAMYDDTDPRSRF
jgi:hypothetical protein